ncbi:MAG: DUF4097 family beta strand repeat-containing protein [Planctomycetota bacterium]|jgi:hypothetical protein
MKTLKNNKFKSLFLLLSILVAVSFQSCIINSNDDDNVNNNQFEAKEAFYYEVPDIGFNTLQVNAINGNIEVVAVAQLDTIIVQGDRIVKSESIADAEDHLPLLQVIIDQSSQTLKIRTEQPSPANGRNYQIDYEIQIPADWVQDLVQTNGNIISSGGQASIKIQSTNGNIIVNNCEADVETVLINGNITITNVTGSVFATLTNGNIISQIVLPVGGECEHKTTNGNIQFSIPTSTSAQFSATTANGSVNISNLNLQNSQISQKSVTGTLGTGQGRIALESVNGIITATGY